MAKRSKEQMEKERKNNNEKQRTNPSTGYDKKLGGPDRPAE